MRKMVKKAMLVEGPRYGRFTLGGRKQAQGILISQEGNDVAKEDKYLRREEREKGIYGKFVMKQGKESDLSRGVIDS